MDALFSSRPAARLCLVRKGTVRGKLAGIYGRSKILGVSGKKATKPRLECESLQLDTVLRAIWSVHDSGNGVLSPFSRHEKVVSF
jgi:hypothetical protein